MIKKAAAKLRDAFYVGVALLFLVGLARSCVKSSPTEAAKPPCATDLDCRIRANTERMAKSCLDAASGRRHVQDKEFDLAQGLRTGSMSAAEVRASAAELEATRRYTANYQAECDAAQAEGQKLMDEAVRVTKAKDAAAQPKAAAKPASKTPSSKSAAKPDPSVGKTAKARQWVNSGQMKVAETSE